MIVLKQVEEMANDVSEITKFDSVPTAVMSRVMHNCLFIFGV
jgi:hypothetical protein